MAVESRFVVIRHGVEVETFMDKKSADEYDKMLDIADNLAVILEQAPITLDENTKEELSIYFAQHRDDLLVALQAKKPKVVKEAVAKQAQPIKTVQASSEEEKKAPAKKARKVASKK